MRPAAFTTAGKDAILLAVENKNKAAHYAIRSHVSLMNQANSALNIYIGKRFYFYELGKWQTTNPIHTICGIP